MANKNKLSIYLIKSHIENVNDIFENSDNISELKRYSDESVAYFVPSYVHEPAWLNSFFHCQGNEFLKQANARVVLLKKLTIDGDTRLFALTFGYARFLFASPGGVMHVLKQPNQLSFTVCTPLKA